MDTTTNRLAPAPLPEHELTGFSAGFTNLYCHDVEAALRFYNVLLGFTETFRTPKTGVPEHVEITLNGFNIALSSVEAAKRVHSVSALPGSPAMALTVWAHDADSAFIRLVKAGVRVVQQPHNAPNNNRAALFRDPDGNLVEVVSRVRSEPDRRGSAKP